MRKIVVAGLAALAAVGVTACVVQAALADAGPKTAAQLVSPSAHVGDRSAYTKAQIPVAWNAVRDRFSAKLPEGYRLPSQVTTEFVAAEPGMKVFVEPAALDMKAATFWRCSQLEHQFSQDGSVSESWLRSMLTEYSQLPSVATYDQTGYSIGVLRAYAKSEGYADAAHALFSLDCDGFAS